MKLVKERLFELTQTSAVLRVQLLERDGKPLAVLSIEAASFGDLTQALAQVNQAAAEPLQPAPARPRQMRLGFPKRRGKR